MKPYSCEVLVVGGGVAGVFAAVAAARRGATTTLLEREESLGGTGQAGMFRQICGLYPNGATVPATTLNGGLTREFAERLAAVSHGCAPERIGKVWLQPLRNLDLGRLLSGLCTEERQLQRLNGHTATAVASEAGRILTITASGPTGTLVIAPSVTIDATGTGAVSAMAGADFDLAPPQDRQLAGLTLYLKGLVNPEAALSLQVPFVCARGVAAGELPPLLRFTTFTCGHDGDDGYCKLSIDGNDDPGREVRARHDARLLCDFLAAALPAFRNATIAAMSPRVLDREGRRIRGEYQLSAEDIVTARKFPDGVVRNAWPMETWDRERGPIYRYGPDGDCYEIPFRCLKVHGFANLLCTGRCISVSREALASTRVMGSCMALGEQAGRAAAYRAVHGSYPAEFSP